MNVTFRAFGSCCLLALAILVAGTAGCKEEPSPPGDGAVSPTDGGFLDGAVVDAAPARDSATAGDSAAPADSGLDWENPGVSATRLESGHYVPRKMDMTTVFPRPPAETVAYAFYKWAYPGMRYEIPIAIQGGAAPLYYELVSGAPGMNLGGFLVDDGNGLLVPGPHYGVLSWDVPASAEGQVHAIVVRVYDQDYQRASNPSAYVELTWDLTVQADRFVFISPTGGGSQDGTLANPIRGFEWYKGSHDDNSYFDKILVYRAGVYLPDGVASSSPTNQSWPKTIQHRKATKPISMIAYPGETVKFDMLGGQTNFTVGLVHAHIADHYYAGIHFEDGYQVGVNNCRVFDNLAGPSHRWTFFKVEVSNIRAGEQQTNDNPGFVWKSKTPIARNKYWAFVRCTVHGGNQTTANGPAFFSLSTSEFVVAEHCRVYDYHGHYWANDKASCNNFTYRFNDMYSSDNTALAFNAYMSNSYDPNRQPGSIEWCFNRGRSTSSTFQAGGAAGMIDEPDRGPAWFYRNNGFSPQSVMKGLTDKNNINIVFERNVLLGPINGKFTTGTTQEEQEARLRAAVAAGDNTHSDTGAEADWFDSDGWLTGAVEDSNLGVRGADIPASSLVE